MSRAVRLRLIDLCSRDWSVENLWMLAAFFTFVSLFWGQVGWKICVMLTFFMEFSNVQKTRRKSLFELLVGVIAIIVGAAGDLGDLFDLARFR